MLDQEADALRRDYPEPAVLPVAADFTEAVRCRRRRPRMPASASFPARPSAISSRTRRRVPAPCRRACSARRTMIIGVDLVKDAAVLNAAYNDAAGVTARFNLNLLARINRELGADFDLARFSHHAFYNPERRASRCIWPATSARRCGSPGGPSSSAPARPSTPRTATSTRSDRLRAGARIGLAPVGRVTDAGARISPSTRWCSRSGRKILVIKACRTVARLRPTLGKHHADLRSRSLAPAVFRARRLSGRT